MSTPRQAIDWEEVKRRLQASSRALERALHPDVERTEAVFRQRAARLAQRRAQAEAPAGTLRVLVFALGEERYALDLSDLTELLPFTGCTPVPGGPPPLLGVLNVHGEIRSVVDLGRLLDLPARDGGTGGYVLLIRRHGREVTLRVDRLEGIVVLAADELMVPGASADGPAFRQVKALGPEGLRLLDTDALLGHAVWKAPA
jgi:purine-binding chemotaxis protein CheW